MSRQKSSRFDGLIWSVVVTATILIALLALGTPAWATPAQYPAQQTVPSPTSPPPPTQTPAPSKEEKPSAPAAVAEVSLSLTASAEFVVPGDVVVLTLQLANNTTAPAEGVVVLLPLSEPLQALEATTSLGNVVIEGQRVRAEVNTLAAGSQALITVRVRVPASVPMGTLFHLQGSLTFAGGERQSNLITLTLPPAELPVTGGAGLSLLLDGR